MKINLKLAPLDLNAATIMVSLFDAKSTALKPKLPYMVNRKKCKLNIRQQI